MTKLSNENIVLRALEPEDIEVIYAWENSSDVWRVSDTRMPISKFMLANYIKTADRDIWESRELRLMIETTAAKSVGTIELFDFEPYHSRVGLGISIMDSSDREKGYATEACDLVERYAAETLGISQIFINIAESNTTSIRFFEKRNYLNTGRKTHWLRTIDGWEDELLYQKRLYFQH
jgi:diamine N-acetyltransferase